MTDVLTTTQVRELSRLLAAVEDEAPIKWMDADECLRYGTIRHLAAGESDLHNPSSGTDVRDAWVRVTTRTGGELTLPVQWFTDHPHDWTVVR